MGLYDAVILSPAPVEEDREKGMLAAKKKARYRPFLACQYDHERLEREGPRVAVSSRGG